MVRLYRVTSWTGEDGYCENGMEIGLGGLWW